jgi:L-ribulose-5-phosphate 3-epimerase
MIGHVGVCSWSLGAGSPEELAQSLAAVGARGVQLALDPIRTGAWTLEKTRRALDGADVTMLSGMMATEGEDYSTLETIRSTGGVRPDEHWEVNLRAAQEDAKIASELDIGLVTFHAGFLPHDPGDPERAVLIERLRTIIDIFGARDIRVGFETGQETAETLTGVMTELGRSSAGVNFDPANMILYGMGDPGQAVRSLGPWIIQAHVKDAVATAVPGTWGCEVVAGTGGVDWRVFFETLAGLEERVNIFVEREAGESRQADIRAGLALIAEFVGEGAGRG